MRRLLNLARDAGERAVIEAALATARPSGAGWQERAAQAALSDHRRRAVIEAATARSRARWPELTRRA